MFVWRVTVQLQSWKCWKYWRMIRFLFFFYSSHSPSSAVLLMLEYFVVFEYFPMTPYAFILILVWMSVIISDDINNKNKNEWSYNIAESYLLNGSVIYYYYDLIWIILIFPLHTWDKLSIPLWNYMRHKKSQNRHLSYSHLMIVQFGSCW